MYELWQPSQTQSQQRKTNARVFALTPQEVDALDDMVTGTIYINAFPAYVLFDCVATHSFISQKFAKALDSLPDHLDEMYRVGTPRRKVLLFDSIYRQCELEMGGQELKADLIKLGCNGV